VNCIDLVELITEYLEGVMAPAARDHVDEHLAECEGCTAYLERCRITIRLTGNLTEEQIPREAREALRGVFRHWRTTTA
jgi:predicted anti-sigma-YlaC factor YlaD